MHLVAIAAFILLVMLEKCCVFSKIDRSENSGLLGSILLFLFDKKCFLGVEVHEFQHQPYKLT